jgi:predicted TIM-barrel fold metal-dependent hydrolase
MRANVEAFLALPLSDAAKSAILDGNARRVWP